MIGKPANFSAGATLTVAQDPLEQLTMQTPIISKRKQSNARLSNENKAEPLEIISHGCFI